MGVRHWAFRDMEFNFEGYYTPDIYQALRNFVSDKSYAIGEHKYAHGWSSEGGQAALGIWVCSKEVEKKYALNVLQIDWKLTWGSAPKPGAGEGAPEVPKGAANIIMHGYTVTDYLAQWGNWFLQPLFLIRDKFFYRRKRDLLGDMLKQDAEEIIKDLREFVSFLPTIR